MHHPDESTLLAYAAGTLDEAFAVLVSCHLETCPRCREAMKTAEMIGGAALASTDEAPLSDGAFGRALEAISAARPEGGSTGARGHLAGRPTNWRKMPRALRHYAGDDLDRVRWRWVAPGVWQKTLEMSEGARSSLRLLRIGPGKAMPEHGHGGQELTLILRGAYEDVFGHFGPGDVADLDVHIEHQPQVVSSVDCICLAATEAPTRFKSLAGRLIQPLIGI